MLQVQDQIPAAVIVEHSGASAGQWRVTGQATAAGFWLRLLQWCTATLTEGLRQEMHRRPAIGAEAARCRHGLLTGQATRRQRHVEHMGEGSRNPPRHCA
jgi:hypothetical protein